MDDFCGAGSASNPLLGAGIYKRSGSGLASPRPRQGAAGLSPTRRSPSPETPLYGAGARGAYDYGIGGTGAAGAWACAGERPCAQLPGARLGGEGVSGR
eukprot:CAMPEP_0183805378 /NCGR_PEP_ID=MMETSP0803_2-20130417/37090_1 /TAXON_ID=195967 /ORGANISM="Crustomastix stigmata, Strain CCMP3273" /LENGTH=98 /DNA_ID=CAMNT_0026050135 /DNA_START=175 /DNA_END=467 /DNA_ORIENTATION=+